jgi:hypothetical protein
MMVMITAITPSLNAASRSFSTAPLLHSTTHRLAEPAEARGGVRLKVSPAITVQQCDCLENVWTRILHLTSRPADIRRRFC